MFGFKCRFGNNQEAHHPAVIFAAEVVAHERKLTSLARDESHRNLFAGHCADAGDLTRIAKLTSAR